MINPKRRGSSRGRSTTWRIRNLQARRNFSKGSTSPNRERSRSYHFCKNSTKRSGRKRRKSGARWEELAPIPCVSSSRSKKVWNCASAPRTSNCFKRNTPVMNFCCYASNTAFQKMTATLNGQTSPTISHHVLTNLTSISNYQMSIKHVINSLRNTSVLRRAAR